MFDVERFTESCRVALTETSAEAAMKELMVRTMERPGDVEAALGTPAEGGIFTLLRSPDLTVLNIVWPPGITLFPHDHRTWAVIGLYGGQEDNTFYRRSSEGLATAGGRELQVKDAIVLGRDVIHAVANPSRRTFTGAIHVYNGDFFTIPRSQWDPATLEERPYEMDSLTRVFAEANERFAAEQQASPAQTGDPD